MQIAIVDNLSGLQQQLTDVAKAGKRVALVPTMGALHAGHISLIEEAKKRADFVVATIFVNPKQFGANEDFSKYPRMLEADIKKLEEAGAALLYAPDEADMYPEGYSTTVSPGDLGTVLCGKFRPGHFDGVATVVSKLLLRVLPHVALFGEKDYQQLCIIRRVVYDLDMPIEIVGVPTMREADGLALSSRNAYLTADERARAPALYRALAQGARSIEGGAPVNQAIGETLALLMASGFKPDYVELRSEGWLEPLENYDRPARLLAAAWLGKTRLIDNIALGVS